MSPIMIMYVWQLKSLTLIILIRKELHDWQQSQQVNKVNSQGARDKGVPEFLIRQAVHDDIWYFSYKIRKGQFLSKAMKDKKTDHAAKLLNKLEHLLQQNIFWVIADEKKFLPESDGELTKPTVMKTKHLVHIWCLGFVTSNGDVMSPFIFPCRR